MTCTTLLMSPLTFVRAAHDFDVFRGMRYMGQMIRQIGVVIGLTIVLTFPVTVVSGAGSQKHSNHAVRAGADAHVRAQVQVPRAGTRAGTKTEKSWPSPQEPRH
jgi:hypothetical protein